MFGIAAGTLLAAGVAAAGVGAAAYGAVSASGSAEDAATTQTAAAGNANQVQWNEFQQQQKNQQPWLQAGTGAVNLLSYGLGGSPNPAMAKPSGEWATQITGDYTKDMQNPLVAAEVNRRYNLHVQGDPTGVVKGHSGGWSQEEYRNMMAGKDTTAAQYQKDLTTYSEQQKTAGDAYSKILPQGSLLAPPQFKFDPNSVNVLQDPGYKFRMEQGQNALTAGSAAAGNYGSGNLGVALQNYGQQLGSQEYGAAYNRAYTSALDQYNAAMAGQNAVFNRLSGVAGTGQTAATNLMSTGANVAGQTGANMINAGINSANLQTQANQIQGQAIMGGVQTGVNAFGTYNQNQLYQNYLQNMQSNQGNGMASQNFGYAMGSGDNYNTSWLT